jgi:colanic acid biosynthesis glycosyl transferase WcaI
LKGHPQKGSRGPSVGDAFTNVGVQNPSYVRRQQGAVLSLWSPNSSSASAYCCSRHRLVAEIDSAAQRRSAALRFLLLSQYFSPEIGAPQVRLLAVAQELQRLGHQVTVVTAMPNYPVGKILPSYRHKIAMKETIKGIGILRTWIYPATGRNIVRRLLNHLSFAFTSFFGCLATQRPDYVIVESPPLFLGLTAYGYSRIVGRQYVMYVSDLWPESAVQLGIMKRGLLVGAAEVLERFLYRKADLVASMTTGMCETIVSRGAQASRVLLLPNGVDVSFFRRSIDVGSTWVAPTEIAFVYAGTHGYAQGLDLILRAAQLVRNRPEIKFLFAGDGPERSRLQDICRKQQISNVRFLGPLPVEQVPGLLSSARASIVPLLDLPLFESARPSKLLTSLACETPVIYCGRGEAADLLLRNGCGLVVPPGQPERLASAVLSLADDASLALRLGAAGRRLAENQYGWEPIVSRLLVALAND